MKGRKGREGKERESVTIFQTDDEKGRGAWGGRRNGRARKRRHGMIISSKLRA